MKQKYILVASILGVFFGSFTLAFALSVTTVGSGGTGVGTFSSGQLIYGNGVNALSSVGTSTLTASAPLTGSFTHVGTGGSLGLDTTGTWSGNAGSASVLSPGRTINGVSFNGSTNIVVASTTLLGDTNTFSGTDLFSNPIKDGTLSGLIAGNTGLTYAVSTTSMNASITGLAGTATALASTPTKCSAGNYPLGIDVNGNAQNCTAATAGTVTSVSATYPISSTGGATPVISTAFGTTTNTGIGTNKLLAIDSAGVMYAVGTSTLTASISGNAATVTTNANLSGAVTSSGSNVTAFGSIGAGVIGTSVTGIPSSQATSTLYGNPTAGYVHTFLNGAMAWAATTTFTGTAPISLTYAGGQVTGSCTTAASGVGGCLSNTAFDTFNGKENALTFSAPLYRTTNAISWFGLSTTTNLTQSQLLYNSTGGNGVQGVATTTEACGTGVACTTHVVLGTGGTITLATMNAGVLGSVINGVAPTSQATSTLYGTGIGGQVLAWINGVPTWTATSSIQNISLTTTGTSGAATLIGNTLNIPQYTGGSSFAYPFSILTEYGTTTAATTTPIWAMQGVFASSTSQFDQISVGSTTSSAMATSTFYGNVNVVGAASSTRIYTGAGSSAAPSLTFGGLGGFYGVGSFGVGFSAGGSTFTFDGSGITMTNTSANFYGVSSGGSAGVPVFSFSSDSNVGVFRPSADNLAFSTNGIEAARFDNAQRLGVGTTTPQWLAQFATTTAPQLTLTNASSTTNAPHWSFRVINDGSLTIATSSASTFATSTANALMINANGYPVFNSLGGSTGCAQFDTTGKLSNTGTACGTGGATTLSGAVTGSGTGAITTAFGTMAQGVLTNASSIATIPTPQATSTLYGSAPASAYGSMLSWDGSKLALMATTTTFSGTTGQNPYFSGTNTLTATSSLFVTTASNWGIGTSTPTFALDIFAPAALPQLSLSAGSGIAKWVLANQGGNFYIASTSVLGNATTTTTALSILGTGAPSLSVGSSSPTFTAVNGMVTLGSNGANGTTTISTGKLQFDGYSASGARTCAYVVGTSWVLVAGACNK